MALPDHILARLAEREAELVALGYSWQAAEAQAVKENTIMLEPSKRFNSWDVYNAWGWVTRVYYDSDMSAQDVKQGLVQHDGYPSNIRVEKVR